MTNIGSIMQQGGKITNTSIHQEQTEREEKASKYQQDKHVFAKR